MRLARDPRPWGLLLGALLCSSLQAQPPSPPPLDKAVDQAVEKGIAWIWSKQNPDGTWTSTVPWLKEYSPGGFTALMCYPLLESGVSPQDARLAKGMDWLAKHESNQNYTRALRCQVWLLANRQTRNKYIKEFEEDVKALVKEGLRWEGKYTYGVPAPGAGQFDNSNCQFGVLGVWAGARANMEFDSRTWQDYWQKVLLLWTKRQCADGGWSYLQEKPVSNASMSAAGVATLFVCLDNLRAPDSIRTCQPAQRPEFKALDRGLEWLDKNFVETIKPKSTLIAANSGLEYYLYCLERVGLAGGIKYFGQADWYRLGAKELLKQQDRNGSWTGGFGGEEQATAFALLFLIRGRNPVLFNKLQYTGDWNNRPRALANLTEWISRNFETTVSWQIINLKAPVAEWHDAPILYLSGARAPKFTEEELARLRLYVQQGGTLLSVSECSGAGFNKGVREVYAKLFPDYEMKPAAKDHDLYTIQFPLKGRPRFHVLSNGVRPLAIHVEEDLSLSWQMRANKTEAWAYEGAANASFYITDKGALRARGVTHWPAEPAAPAKKVKVARVKYGGNWEPEPLAYERFGRLLAAEVGIGLDVSAVEANDLASCGAAVAGLTGTSVLSLSEAQKESIKKFVTGGGLLVVDAAGGAKAFADSSDELMRELFGADSVQRLPADSPVFRAKEMKEPKFRRAARARLGKGMTELPLMGVTVGGRLGVVLSREDITCGLVGYASYACDGYMPETAYEVMRNVVLVAAGDKEPRPTPSSAPAAE